MAKIERLKKAELVAYCKGIGLETKGKSKDTLKVEAQEYHDNKIRQAIEVGKGDEFLTENLEILAEEYAVRLKSKIAEQFASDD